MKHTFILLSLFLLLIQVAVAQTISKEEELMKQLNTEQLSKVRVADLPAGSLIYQAGAINNAAVRQRSAGPQSNGAFIMQVGSYNQATLQQQGQGNRAGAVQVGGGNRYTGEFSGLNNSSAVLQQGAGNTVTQRVQGVNLEHTLIQRGSNNTINQVETSPNSRSYQVVQEGHNMNITIEQSNWARPPVTGKK